MENKVFSLAMHPILSKDTQTDSNYETTFKWQIGLDFLKVIVFDTKVCYCIEDISDVQPHIRRIWLFYATKDLTSWISLRINLGLFGYLYHFLHNALIAADNMCGIISFFVVYFPILYCTVIHRWPIQRVAAIFV